MVRFLLALLCMGMSPPASALGVDFRGYILGLDLAAFKSRPVEDDEGLRPVCTDDSEVPYSLTLSPEEKRAGVIRCSFERMINGKWYQAGISLKPGLKANASFDFFEGRLFKIEVFTNITAKQLILSGLTEKFGQPQSQTAFDFQVRSGAVFPGERSAWRFGPYSVTLLAPDFSVNRVSVYYIDDTQEARVAAKLPNRVKM